MKDDLSLFAILLSALSFVIVQFAYFGRVSVICYLYIPPLLTARNTYDILDLLFMPSPFLLINIYCTAWYLFICVICDLCTTFGHGVLSK